MVEVVGMVSNKGVLMASAYTILHEEKGIAFGWSSFLCVCHVKVASVSFSSFYVVINYLCSYPPDLELYNEALKVIHDFPQYYPFEVATSG